MAARTAPSLKLIPASAAACVLVCLMAATCTHGTCVELSTTTAYQNAIESERDLVFL